MNNPNQELERRKLTIAQRMEIDQICGEFDRTWKAAAPRDLAMLMNGVAQELQPALLEELLKIEVEYRLAAGQKVSGDAYLPLFPQFQQVIERQFAPAKSPIDARLDATAAMPRHVEPNSQAGRLVELIRQYQNESTSNFATDPVAWAAKHPEFGQPLLQALKGLDDMRRAADPNSIRKQIGDFTIIREIGRGGMGAVFEAEQKSLGRRVALKVLWFGTANDVSAIQRFQREAETIAQLHHTHIVPIYSVGTEGSINYFAMQLIDGQSLDQVIKQNPNGLDPTTAVTWGLQAAEALAHAHQRGVVHRDIKPSNLLLDRVEQLWLTDFGLAKRSDDVTLSMAGALMGTPRYMSPEQASASTRNVDHRSDIYSLGATLYEILTGQPVHNATTPHGIISQILSAEIVPPRRRRGDVPRDIDTVLMKCLDKDPGNRYATATDLASDLRAILESRPIQARRIGLLEQSQKWLTRHHRNVKWTAASVCGTLASLLLCWVGWLTYTGLNAAQLTIETAEGNLVAEIFDSRGRTVTQPIAVPMQSPITLPAGDYRVRFSADDYLSQDAMLTLAAQQHEKFSFTMREQRSFEPITEVHDMAFVQGTGQTIGVTYDVDRLQIKIGEGLKYDLPWSTIQDDGRVPGWIWPINRLVAGNNKFGKLELRPWILEQGEDLNGDGNTEFVIAFRHQACVAACGRNGWLWVNGSTSDLATANPNESNKTNFGIGLKSTVVDAPKWIGDIDGDGTKDLLVGFADLGKESLNELIRDNRLTQASRRWLEVLSGATGKSIWRFDLPTAMFELPAGTQAPLYSCWFPESYRNTSGSNRSSVHGGQTLLVRDCANDDSPTGPSIELPTIEVGMLGNQPAIVVASSSMILAVDQQSGNPLSEPTSTGVVSVRQPIVQDLNGDRQTDILLVGETKSGTTAADHKVTAWSVFDRKELWSHDIESGVTGKRISFDPLPGIGLVEDLDGDGVAEVLLPSQTSKSLTASRFPWGELQVLGGVDGKVRWTARIYNCDSTADRFVVGPDVNGDSFRDVLVVSQWGSCDQLVAECRSGADGSILWIQSHPILQNGQSYFALPPTLWHSGADGWPQLLVTLLSRSSDPLTVTFSTRNGHVTSLISGFDETRIVDTDGDFIEDLCLIKNKLPGQMNIANGMNAVGVRGTANETVRQVGVDRVLDGTDFDGDGVQDCLFVCGDDVVAKSPVDGRSLWRVTDVSTMPNCRTISWESTGADPKKKELWDFDKDGIRDIVFDHSGFLSKFGSSITAISGKSGRQISRFEFVQQSHQGKSRIDIVDVDHDTQAELVVYGFSDFEIDRRGGFDTTQGRLSLAVFDARSGRAKWRTALSREFGDVDIPQLNYDFNNVKHAEFLAADQNGDGELDLIALGESNGVAAGTTKLSVICCDGRNGSIIWRQDTNALTDQPDRAFKMAPNLALLEGDSSRPGNVLLFEAAPGSSASAGSLLLRRLDTAGRNVWVYNVKSTTGSWNHSDDRRLRPTPVVLYGENGRARIVCQAQLANVQWQLFVLDENGNKVGEIETQQNNFPVNYSVLPVDLPGEANDWALYWGCVENSCCLMQATVWGEVKKVREFPTNGADPTYSDVVLDRKTGLENEPAIRMIVCEQAKLQARCFDIASGQKLWTCLGPTVDSFTFPALNARALMNSNLKAPLDRPFVLFHSGNQVFCRSVSLTGQTSPAFNLRNSDGPAQKESSISVRDFRLMRNLPGVEGVRSEIEGGLWRWVLIAGIGTILLIVIPGWQVRSMFRRRQWSIRGMMLAAAVVALGLMFLLSPIPGAAIRSGGSLPVWLLLYLAICGTPVWIFLRALVRWSWSRQYGRLVASLALILVASILSAGVMPELQLRGVNGLPTEPGEHLSFAEAYLLLIPGFYVANWIYVLVIGLLWIAKSIRAVMFGKRAS